MLFSIGARIAADRRGRRAPFRLVPGLRNLLTGMDTGVTTIGPHTVRVTTVVNLPRTILVNLNAPALTVVIVPAVVRISGNHCSTPFDSGSSVNTNIGNG